MQFRTVQRQSAPALEYGNSRRLPRYVTATRSPCHSRPPRRRYVRPGQCSRNRAGCRHPKKGEIGRGTGGLGHQRRLRRVIPPSWGPKPPPSSGTFTVTSSTEDQHLVEVVAASRPGLRHRRANGGLQTSASSRGGSMLAYAKCRTQCCARAVFAANFSGPSASPSLRPDQAEQYRGSPPSAGGNTWRIMAGVRTLIPDVLGVSRVPGLPSRCCARHHGDAAHRHELGRPRPALNLDDLFDAGSHKMPRSHRTRPWLPTTGGQATTANFIQGIPGVDAEGRLTRIDVVRIDSGDRAGANIAGIDFRVPSISASLPLAPAMRSRPWPVRRPEHVAVQIEPPGGSRLHRRRPDA